MIQQNVDVSICFQMFYTSLTESLVTHNNITMLDNFTFDSSALRICLIYVNSENTW